MSDPTPKVLVIEDEADIRRFVRMSLELEGFEGCARLTACSAVSSRLERAGLISSLACASRTEPEVKGEDGCSGSSTGLYHFRSR